MNQRGGLDDEQLLFSFLIARSRWPTTWQATNGTAKSELSFYFKVPDRLILKSLPNFTRGDSITCF